MSSKLSYTLFSRSISGVTRYIVDRTEACTGQGSCSIISPKVTNAKMGKLSHFTIYYIETALFNTEKKYAATTVNLL